MCIYIWAVSLHTAILIQPIHRYTDYTIYRYTDHTDEYVMFIDTAIYRYTDF